MIVVDVRWASPLKPLLYRMASFTRTPSTHGFAHWDLSTVNGPQPIVRSRLSTVSPTAGRAGRR